MEPETRKILGHVNKENMSFIQRSDLKVSATCTRVNVTDGHMALVSLRFSKRPPPSAEQVKKAMREYVSDAQRLGCPSAPDPAITVLEQVDRPQPRLDRDVGRGYSVSVGRVREDPTGVFDLMFAALSHNSKFTSYSARLSQLINTLSCHRRCWIINTKRRSCCSKGAGVESSYGTNVWYLGRFVRYLVIYIAIYKSLEWYRRSIQRTKDLVLLPCAFHDQTTDSFHIHISTCKSRLVPVSCHSCVKTGHPFPSTDPKYLRLP